MGLLDFLKCLFSNGKTSTNIIVEDFVKVKGGVEPLQVCLTDNDNNPLTDKDVIIEVNDVPYTRKTDDDGIARLNINLGVGEYKTIITYTGDADYNKSTAHCNVIVNPVLSVSDVAMTYKDGTRFTALLTDGNGEPIGGVGVVFHVNGVDYNRTSDSEGVVGLNINLPVGEYIISTKINNITLSNKISIQEAVKDNGKSFGYWLFGKDLYNADINALKSNGVTDIFLNYYSIKLYGEERVIEWIKKVSPLRVHIWMQCFYDGEWYNPASTNLNSKISEAKKYANMTGVAGVHLDYLRYPGTAYKTDGASDAITGFVRNVKNNIPSNIILSCAVMPENETKYYYGQDIQALGEIVDYIIPMQYKGNYNTGTNWLASTTKNFTNKAKILSGLQAYKSDNNTTLLSETELNNDISTCLDNGAEGVLLFRYGLSTNIDFKKWR